MKRTHSNMSDNDNSESIRDNKRIKITTCEDLRQWYEFDELLGAFINLASCNTILNFAATSKTLWSRFHSKNVWQAAGRSLFYASNIIDKEVLKALLNKRQFALDAPRILQDLMSPDRDRNIGAACHMNQITDVDKGAWLQDATTKSIFPRLLEFVDLHDYPTLQIASMDLLAMEFNEPYFDKLVSVILTTKSRDVKYSALWALGNQFSYSPQKQVLSRQLVDNKELMANLMSTISLDGVVSNILASSVRLLNMMCVTRLKWDVVEPIMSAIMALLLKTPPPPDDCLTFACGALANIIEDRDIQEVGSVVKNWEKIVELTTSAKLRQLQVASVQLLNQICLSAGGTLDFDMIRNPLLLSACEKFLEISDLELRRETALLVSNLVTTPACVQSLLDSTLMPVIQKLIANDDRQVGLIILNMMTCGDPEQLKKLCTMDVLRAFSRILDPSTTRIADVLDGIAALDRLCDLSKENGFWDIVWSKSQAQVIPGLEGLQAHPSNQLFERSCELLDAHFSVFEIEDDA